jgi:hypothetical protein
MKGTDKGEELELSDGKGGALYRDLIGKGMTPIPVLRRFLSEAMERQFHSTLCSDLVEGEKKRYNLLP